VAPIICYESVYGNYVNGYVTNGAQFLAIITNDAWWHETQGHKQHLSFAQLRAIETRRDVARSANTGISAFINQKGEVTQQSKYGEKIALKGTVQLNNKLTFYVQQGDYLAKLAIGIGFILLLLIGIKPLRKHLQ
jgi:apolipoprotein N-acyltransferase